MDRSKEILLKPFQSALPRGERLQQLRYAPEPKHFNPRSREGSDGSLGAVAIIPKVISIRAPARGATDPGKLQ